MRRIVLFTAIAAALSLLAADRARETKLQQAIDLMGTKGDLPGAIKLLEDVAKSPDRNLAARSLLYMGDCRQKLGQKESRTSYERIVKDFTDQKDVVAEARGRLAALGGGGQAGQLPTRLVWAGPKAAADSVSPDGRYLSYTDWDTGNLLLHDLVSDTDRLLTSNGNMDSKSQVFAYNPVISKDGKQVAYTYYDYKTKRNEPWVTDLGGDAHPRRLFDGAAWICGWSPDGKWLVVTTQDEHTVGIGLLPAQGGTPRSIKSWPAGPGRIWSASFSPDGKYIAYTRGATPADSHRGYILSVDGKSESALAPESSDTRTAMWSPEGSRIVWVSGNFRAASRALWSIRVANGKPVGEPEQLKANSGFSSLTGFAHDGSLYYSDVSPAASDIHLAGLDPATGKLTSIPKRVSEHGLGTSNCRIAWLPDGKALSFWSTREGRTALVVHALTTGEERELWENATGASDPGYAGWFPDGNIMQWKRNAQSLVFSRLDGRTLEAQAIWTVPSVPAPGQTAFSRDLMTQFIAQKDESAACEGRICTYVILARDLQTSRDREICRFRALAVGSLARSVSPDGRDLALLQIGDNDSVLIVPTAGGSPREIYRDTDGDFIGGPEWTQDGDHVLAFHYKSGQAELWSVPVKGGPPEKSALNGQTMPSNPTVSPDGTQIAFLGYVRSMPQVWVMTGLSGPAPAAR